MSNANPSQPVLSAPACRNGVALQHFVIDHISVNAWPIHSRALIRRIEHEGLDPTQVSGFSLHRSQLVALMHHIYRTSRRAERLLSIRNAFHCTMHNFEVFIRLLVLEWPQGISIPEEVARAPLQAYLSLESVLPVAVRIMDALHENGVSGAIIARSALTALGHDYGHTGGTDRIDAAGQPLPLTHEEMAEKHIAAVGLRFGYPPALILESMAGIRATTFHNRPGRPRVQPSNAFERRITLADVMGCALPPDRWLTHVAAPVLLEKIPVWRRRTVEIAREEQSLREQAMDRPHDHEIARSIADRQNALATESASIIQNIGEWFRSERGFFVFIDAQKLRPLPEAQSLWGDIVQQKIVLIDSILAKEDLLKPLVAQDGALLEQFARQLSNAPDLTDRLTQGDVDPLLSELLQPFVVAQDARHKYA